MLAKYSKKGKTLNASESGPLQSAELEEVTGMRPVDKLAEELAASEDVRLAFSQ